MIFLFPIVESGVHNYAHRNDFHCVASKHHLHKAEHHCNICDFTSVVSASPSFTDYHFELSSASVVRLSFSADRYILESRDFLSLRAPPSLV